MEFNYELINNYFNKTKNNQLKNIQKFRKFVPKLSKLISLLK